MASWLIPALVGGASALFGNHSANKRAQQERDDANHRAQQQYNSHLLNYNQAIKLYNMRRGMAEDFIDRHGLKPGKSVVDYLNSAMPNAPTFDEVGGGLSTPSYGAADNVGGGESFLSGMANTVGKVLSNPNRTPPPAAPSVHDNGDMSAYGSGVGPRYTPPEPSLDLSALEDEAGGTK